MSRISPSLLPMIVMASASAATSALAADVFGQVWVPLPEMP